MSSKSGVLIVLLTASFINSSSVRGSDPFTWDEITEADWKLLEDSIGKSSDAVMIFEKVTSDEENLEDSKCYWIIYRRIAIFTDVGREWGDVEVPMISIEQKIKDIQGRTILRDRTIIPLEEEHIFEKEAVKTKDLKFKQRTFSIPGVTYDCIIEYMIKYQLDNPATQWLVQKEIPLLKAELRWIFAIFTMTQLEAELFGSYLSPNYLWLNRYSDCKVTQLPNVKKPTSMLFESGFVPAYEKEPFSLPDAALKTKLLSYYGTNAPPEAYWGDRSQAIDKNMKEFCKKNKKLKVVVESFGELSNTEEKIKSAYDWVQENITNISYYDLFDPDNPDKKKKLKLQEREYVNDVIELGYGSRDEINYVFCDMLREMNIDAKYAYAKDRSEDIFIKDAKFWQFDRTLIVVESGESQYKFYSPGHALAPIDQLPWFIEGVTVLVGGTNNYMIHTPFSSANQNQISSLYNYMINDEYTVTGSMSARITGQPARTIRIEVLDKDSSEHKQILLDSFRENFPNCDIEIESYRNLDIASAAAIIQFTLDHGELSMAGDKILFKPMEYISNAKNQFYASERQYPILFDYAYTSRETAEFRLPENWTIDATPGDTIFQNQAGQCQIDFEVRGRVLSIQRFFVIEVPFWPVDYYPLISELFQAQQDFADQIVIINVDSD